MNKNEISNKPISMWHLCGAMCGGRTSGIFWGVLFIVIGLYWVGKIAGWFPSGSHMFWPIVFIAAGIWFIFSALKKREHH